MNQACWICLQPLAAVLTNAYGMSNTEIASVSMIYMLVFVFVVFPTNYILDKGSLQIGMLAGFFLTLAGMWVKCLINHSLIYVYVGQLIAAIG